MQSRGKQEKNADRENRIERDEEYLRLFQRGQKILEGAGFWLWRYQRFFFLSGIYFTLSGRGEWIDMAAVLIPFLITGAILLFLASPYKKGAAEVKNTAGAPSKGRKSSFSPSTWRITSSFSETSSGKFAVLSGILFLTAGILILMERCFSGWDGQRGIFSSSRREPSLYLWDFRPQPSVFWMSPMQSAAGRKVADVTCQKVTSN